MTQEQCPVCGSTEHSTPFEIVTHYETNDDWQGNLKSYPMTHDFVYCKKCGVTRLYDSC